MKPTDFELTREHVQANEKCYGVLDLDMLTPDYKATHRYRLTYVIRDDKPKGYIEDLTELGKYSVFANHPAVQLFTLLEHTVAEAWDITDAAYDVSRVRDKLKTLEAQAQEHSIVKDYWDKMASVNEWIRRNERTAKKAEEYRGR